MLRCKQSELLPCRYYFTAALADNPMVGRKRIQFFGFLGVGTLFMVAAGAYHPLTTKGGIGTFQFIYFFSSFVVRAPFLCTSYPDLYENLHSLAWASSSCSALAHMAL